MKKFKLLLPLLCVGLLITGCGEKTIPVLENGEEVVAKLDGKDISVTELYTELQSFADAKLSKLQEVAYRKVESFLVENIESYKIEDIEYLNLRYIDSFGGYVADFGTYMEGTEIAKRIQTL